MSLNVSPKCHLIRTLGRVLESWQNVHFNSWKCGTEHVHAINVVTQKWMSVTILASNCLFKYASLSRSFWMIFSYYPGTWNCMSYYPGADRKYSWSFLCLLNCSLTHLLLTLFLLSAFTLWLYLSHNLVPVALAIWASLKPAACKRLRTKHQALVHSYLHLPLQGFWTRSLKGSPPIILGHNQVHDSSITLLAIKFCE